MQVLISRNTIFRIMGIIMIGYIICIVVKLSLKKKRYAKKAVSGNEESEQTEHKVVEQLKTQPNNDADYILISKAESSVHVSKVQAGSSVHVSKVQAESSVQVSKVLAESSVQVSKVQAESTQALEILNVSRNMITNHSEKDNDSVSIIRNQSKKDIENQDSAKTSTMIHDNEPHVTEGVVNNNKVKESKTLKIFNEKNLNLPGCEANQSSKPKAEIVDLGQHPSKNKSKYLNDRFPKTMYFHYSTSVSERFEKTNASNLSLYNKKKKKSKMDRTDIVCHRRFAMF